MRREDFKMELSYSVMARHEQFVLARYKENCYGLLNERTKQQDIIGTMEEVKAELTRWMVEVDFENPFMLELEKKFINALNQCKRLHGKTLSRNKLIKEFNNIGLSFKDNTTNDYKKYMICKGEKSVIEINTLYEGTFYLLYLLTGLVEPTTY